MDVVVDGVVRHCEVKGSSVVIDTIELTINEALHAGDLPVVGTNSTPAEPAFWATKYSYSLPDGGESI